MSLWQALLYFLGEASKSLVRSIKVSSLAVVVIGLSLFLGGFFFMVTENLRRTVAGWGDELKVVVYLSDAVAETGPEARELELMLARAPWVKAVVLVGREAARERFRSQFPSLEDVLGDSEDHPLPAALEAGLDPQRLDERAFQSWLEEVRDHPATALVDDDRDWLEQVSRLVAMLRAVGFALAGVLLLAAIFTTASVVRLTAYLYLDEIAVMRLVGATEFYIRGPFYAEGLLQGFLGGLISVAALDLSQGLLRGQGAGGAELWLPQLVSRPLSVGQQILLVLIGSAAGLLGAVLSLRREKLRPDSEES